MRRLLDNPISNVPVKLLTDRCRLKLEPALRKISKGIDPDSMAARRKTSSISRMRPISVGMVEPRKLFELKSRCLKLTRFPISLGICNDSRFASKDRYVKDDRLPISGGIDPSNSFWERSKFVNEGAKRPISALRLPARLLPIKTIISIAF